MGQIDLGSCTEGALLVPRKVYTKDDVERKCKIWHKSNQLGFDGWPFFTFNDLEEVEWVKADVSIELLEKFERLYSQGKLNRIIKYICSKSNDLGGFHDYGVCTIRNRLTSQYIFDSRKVGDANE